MIRSVIVSFALAACVAWSIAGCTSTTSAGPTAKPTKPAGSLGGVAAQMHDVCGSFLLFVHAHRRLPKSLDELCLVTGQNRAQLIDPVTTRPFVYNPNGFAELPNVGKAVLAASEANGKRWCVVIDQSAAAPNCRVLALPADLVHVEAGG